MANTLALGASAERFEGSSPSLPTKKIKNREIPQTTKNQKLLNLL